MRIAGVGILGAAATMLLGTVGASNAKASEDAVTSAVMDAEDIVAARRAAYFLSTQAVGQIKAGIDEGGDLRRTRSGAMMLANWAKVLASMFPDGTDLDSSRALSTVWSDREGFEAKANDYREAALKLAEVAQTGDRAAANSAFMAMAGTCHACHEAYREK